MLTRPSGYMPQLDALRAFAVLLVIIYHWFPIGEGFNRLPNGTIGVVIFFVLSGFLITQILIQNRNLVQMGQRSLQDVYRNFVIRRFLRLFPLYYLIITFVLLVLPQTSDIDDHPLYYYLYGYNILLHKTGNWADILSPFWTLGVEEQLYLFWPWIVLLTPRESFRWVILGMIIGGIVFRAYEYTQGDIDGVLTPASFDTFGAGALWAHMVIDYPDQLSVFLKKLSIAAGLALFGFIGLLLLPGDHLLVVLFQRTFISAMALFIIARASLRIQGLAGKLLDNSALQYVGRISYGIYVFHMIVPGFGVPLLIDIAHWLHIPIQLGYWSHRFVSLLAVLAVSSASWYVFEKPFNELKRYFPQKRVDQSLS